MKKVITVNDLSSFGRCSLSVIMPILACLKIQAIPIITSIFTTHTGGFIDIESKVLTNFMPNYLKSYKSNKVDVDCIYTGYISDGKQVDFIKDYKKHYKNALFIVDPVMADHGKIYSKITEDIIKKIKELSRVADVITPNLTEAAILLDENYEKIEIDEKKAVNWLKKLKTMGPKNVIIKGIQLEDCNFYNFVLENDEIYKIKYRLINENYPGTGDIFASIITGCYVNGYSLKESVTIATEFLEKVIESTFKEKTDKRNGVNFEKYLYLLCDKT
ncbi:MAG: pyridoxamine kinase [Oscillospiraceae bacterium]